MRIKLPLFIANFPSEITGSEALNLVAGVV